MIRAHGAGVGTVATGDAVPIAALLAVRTRTSIGTGVTDLSATTIDFVVIKLLPVANAAAGTGAAVVPLSIPLDVVIAVTGAAAVV